MALVDIGTTSACAENTPKLHTIIQGHGNYLRVRGEYFGGAFDDDYFVELPPRARRILVSLLLGLRMGGTTSACAENTFE